MLYVAGVGFALASIVSVMFGHACSKFGSSECSADAGFIALVAAGTTWIVSAFWAAVLRWPVAVGRRSFRYEWIASMPLAVVNSSLAAVLLLAFERPGQRSALVGAFLCATVGGMFWVPALLWSLICVCAHIAWAQRLSMRGLAGAEQGERIVGVVCVAVGLLAVAVASGGVNTVSNAGCLATQAFGLSAVVTGGATLALALARQRRRRRFVADAEAGKIADYRVDPSRGGKVLVRVMRPGQGYRLAEFDEEVFELDERGEATRSLEASSRVWRSRCGRGA